MPKAKPARVRIAIVNDQELMRELLAAVCGGWPQGQVVMQACDGVDYEEQLATVGPVDIVIMDLAMPRRDGYETIAWIKEQERPERVIALSAHMDVEAAHRALHAGAHALLDLSMSRTHYHDALEALLSTGVYGNALMLAAMTYKPNLNSPAELLKKLKALVSPRELEFLLHYIDEASRSRHKIADIMGIEPCTAETHRRHIVEKTGANTRLAMLKMAIRFGLVSV